ENPPFDVDQWLRGPDRKEFSWNVSASSSLSLQQRHVLQVIATIPGSRLPESRVGRDLHFVLKIAAADNRWVPGYSYTRVPVPPKLEKFHSIAFADRVYLRPGRYTVALMVYDPVLEKGNLWRKQLRVLPTNGDPLPELDRNLKYIQFMTPSDSLLAEGREWLPVKNKRRLCVDVVANVPVDRNYNDRRGEYPRMWDTLQASSVLSNLTLSNGHVRVTILDPLRMKTHFDRENAAKFDWHHAGEVLAHQDSTTIDKSLVAAQTEASAYLFDKLNEILEDNACAPSADSPLKVVIVVSRHIVFPKHTEIRRVSPQNPKSVRFYYVRLTGQYRDDDLAEMLQQTKPEKMSGWNATQFRMDLADLISYLETME
ncbi:MAG: hypothetical protein H6Q07_707, partial [Acidobacteria bacterium]|nr:hypothetical protein [Acidobacteriota bacterium]